MPSLTHKLTVLIIWILGMLCIIGIFLDSRNLTHSGYVPGYNFALALGMIVLVFMLIAWFSLGSKESRLGDGSHVK